jgi:PAS domain S-box-containing protein
MYTLARGPVSRANYIFVTMITIQLEQMGDLAIEPLTPPIGATLVLFVLVVAVLSLFLDRFGSVFRSALTSAITLADDNARLYNIAQEQRARLLATLASIGDAVITTDIAGQVTFLNSVADRLTGWASADAVGKPLHEVLAIVNEETHDVVSSPLEAVLHEGMVVGLANHTLLLARDGREIPIDDSGAPIRDDQGAIIGVVLTFRDITERRQAETALRQSQEQFDAILRGVADGVTLQDPSGRLLYANDTAARLLGMPSAEALVEMPAGSSFGSLSCSTSMARTCPPIGCRGGLRYRGRFRPRHWCASVSRTPV